MLGHCERLSRAFGNWQLKRDQYFTGILAMNQFKEDFGVREGDGTYEIPTNDQSLVRAACLPDTKCSLSTCSSRLWFLDRSGAPTTTKSFSLAGPLCRLASSLAPYWPARSVTGAADVLDYCVCLLFFARLLAARSLT